MKYTQTILDHWTARELDASEKINLINARLADLGTTEIEWNQIQEIQATIEDTTQQDMKRKKSQARPKLTAVTSKQKLQRQDVPTTSSDIRFSMPQPLEQRQPTKRRQDVSEEQTPPEPQW